MDVSLINELSKLTDINSVIAFLKANPTVLGLLGIGSFGSIIYYLKWIPSYIWSKIVKYSTTTIEIDNGNSMYNEIISYLASSTNFLVRDYSLDLDVASSKGRTRDRYGDMIYADSGSSKKVSTENYVKIGYGRYPLFINKQLVLVNRFVPADSGSDTYSLKRKEVLRLTLFGGKNSVNKFIQNAHEFSSIRKQSPYRCIKYTVHGEEFIVSFDTEEKSNLSLDKDVKQEVESSIEQFISSKDRYKTMGLPYRTGILLYGPPGTGKTSFIKHLACKFKKDIVPLDLGKITESDLHSALNYNTNAFIVFEDIDTQTSNIKKREEKSEDPAPKASSSITTGISLYKLLNSLDGLSSPDGAIFIATTNHIDNLDSALLRSGRFDTKVELGYATNEMLTEYLTKIYSDFKSLPDGFQIKDNTPMCDVQKHVKENMNDYSKVLEAVSK